MKIISITRKTLLELLREPLLLLVLLAFPLLLLGFYDLASGQSDQGMAQFLKLLVINEDAGTFDNEGRPVQAGTQLVEAITHEEFEGLPTFEVTVVHERHTAETALREHKVALLLVIPTHFSQALVDSAAAGSNEASEGATLVLAGDTTSDSFVFAHSLLTDLVHQFADEMAGHPSPLTITYAFTPGTGTMSDFDFGVGGIMVFGIMFLVVTTAQLLVRERTSGTMQRLQLAPLRATSFLSGITLAQMGVALVQVVLTLGVALALGFENHGSLALTIGIGLLLSLSAVGVGIIVASFARSDGEAANLGSGVLVPMVLVSGALFAMPEAPIATLAGRTIHIYDLLPTTHAAEALRRVLISGEGLAAVGFELAAMSMLAAIMLAAGVVLYRRLHLK